MTRSRKQTPPSRSAVLATPHEHTSIPVSEEVRTWTSLLIFIHFFSIGAVLIAKHGVATSEPASLSQRIANVLGPYVHVLHLDPMAVPYSLTGDISLGGTYQWQAQLPDGSIISFPNDEWWGGFPRERLEQLAYVGSLYAESQLDEVTAEIARSLARHVGSQKRERFPVNAPLSIRCLRSKTAEPAEQSNGETRPATEEAFETIYNALVWTDAAGMDHVLKRGEPGQVAPPIHSTVPAATVPDATDEVNKRLDMRPADTRPATENGQP